MPPETMNDPQDRPESVGTVVEDGNNRKMINGGLEGSRVDCRFVPL
jgi:hypothetical protein